MELSLTEDDATLLRDLLDVTLRELSYEISDTDDYDFRQTLKARRDRLQAVFEQLGGEAAPQA